MAIIASLGFLEIRQSTKRGKSLFVAEYGGNMGASVEHVRVLFNKLYPGTFDSVLAKANVEGSPDYLWSMTWTSDVFNPTDNSFI